MRKVTIGVTAFIVTLSVIALVRWNLWNFGADTGTFAQVILDSFGGFRDGPEDGSHFRFHWAPILALLYPAVALTHTGLILEVAQIVLIACSAYPLYALLLPYAGERIASYCALLALWYPPLIAVAFLEFHEIAFYPVLALLLVWAADRERWWVFGCLAMLAMLVREEVCAVFACCGVLLAAVASRSGPGPGRGLLLGAPRTPRAACIAGLALAAASLATLAFYFGFVIPRVGSWQPSRFYEYSFAHGPLAVLLAFITQPAAAFAEIVTLKRLGYVLEAFGPLAFLPLLSPWSLAAVPGFLVVLLSSDGITWRMGSHYAAIWIPWLLVAASSAIVALGMRHGEKAAERACLAVAAASAIVLAAFNPTHAGHYLHAPYADTFQAARALASVPRNAAVVTHDEWFTRIAGFNPNATIFLRPSTQFAVFADDFPNEEFRRTTKPELERAVARHEFNIVRRYGKVTVYQRVAGGSPAAIGRASDAGRRQSHSAPSVNSRIARPIAKRGPSPA